MRPKMVYNSMVLFLFAVSPGIPGILFALFLFWFNGGLPLTGIMDIVFFAFLGGLYIFSIPAVITGILYLWKIQSNTLTLRKKMLKTGLIGALVTFFYLFVFMSFFELFNRKVEIMDNLILSAAYSIIGFLTAAFVVWLIDLAERRFLRS